MTAIPKDPFSIVYDALWAILEANPNFCTLVPSQCRIKFSGTNRDPLKDTVQAEDTPEVRIVPAGGSCNTHIASNTVSIIKRFAIQIGSGDRRMDAALFPVEFQILCAMVPAAWTTIVTALKWNNISQGTAGGWGIDLVDLTDNQEGISDEDLSRGIAGWSTVWACEVRLWFAASVIKPVVA